MQNAHWRPHVSGNIYRLSRTVYDSSGEYLGYVRLRFGRLTARTAPTDKIIYLFTFANPWQGGFYDEAQCEEHLQKIAKAFLENLDSHQ